MTLRRSETLVESQPSRPQRTRGNGFTLLEIQIAIVILALAMIGMIGHGRVYERLLGQVQREHRLDGVALAADKRVVVSVAQVGAEPSPPRCEVELDSIEESAGSLSAEIRVTRRTP